MIRICRTNSDDKNLHILIKELDADLHKRNGDDQFQYDLYNKIESLPTVVIAFDDNKPIGCACFKKFDISSVELKRMYLYSDYRGNGIAGLILSELEKWAVETGACKIVLETGLKQPEAIRFYTKNEYVQIPNYGQYVDNTNSICMEKIIFYKS